MEEEKLDVHAILLLLDESLLAREIPSKIARLSDQIQEISASARLREIKDSHVEKSEGLAEELYSKMLLQKKKLQLR